MRTQLGHTYEDIISVGNLLAAWRQFLKGKRRKKDVQDFQYQLADNLLELHRDLKNKAYAHGGYYAFNISDPKPRNIHKALVRDRLLHHAIYLVLYPFFDRKFIADSFSCRLNKGTHKAVERFRSFAYKVSRNNTRTCWILKCDVRKFFASIDHSILLEILNKHIQDKNVLWLLERIVRGFEISPGKGLPLGNLTSQLLVNIYMNEFDQYAKHKLKATHYIRYADDFVFLSEHRQYLEDLISKITNFLGVELGLSLHPDKVYIKTLASGVDFLGWVHFPDHRVLRTATRRRMLKTLRSDNKPAVLESYLGLLKHGNTQKLMKEVEKVAGKLTKNYREKFLPIKSK